MLLTEQRNDLLEHFARVYPIQLTYPLTVSGYIDDDLRLVAMTPAAVDAPDALLGQLWRLGVLMARYGCTETVTTFLLDLHTVILTGLDQTRMTVTTAPFTLVEGAVVWQGATADDLLGVEGGPHLRFLHLYVGWLQPTISFTIPAWMHGALDRDAEANAVTLYPLEPSPS